MSFLNSDSKFMTILSKVVDYILLNLLCFVFCLPVVTIGASLTAKYYVSMKMVRGEEPAIGKSFLKAFRGNFMQATVIWLLSGSSVLICIIDWWLLNNVQTQMENIFIKSLLIVVSLWILCIDFCAFPMLARFRVTIKELIKNAFVFSIIHLPRMLLVVVFAFLPYFIGYWCIEWFPAIWLLFTSVALYYNSLMYVNHFKKLEKSTKIEGDISENF